MRTSRQRLVAISLVVCVLPAQGVGLQGLSQRPVKRTVLNDHPALSSEVADVPRLFAAPELVVVGRILSQRPADVVLDPSQPNTIRVATVYAVAVDEVFRHVPRAEPSAGDLDPLKLIEVIIPFVGDRDRGAYVERYVSAQVNALGSS